MTLLETLLLVGAAALGFFLLVDSALYLVANTGDRGLSRRNRRLAIAKAAAADARIETLAREPVGAATTIGGYLDGLLAASDANFSRTRVYIVMAVIAATTLVAMMFFVRWLPLAAQLLVAIPVGIGLPIMQLKSKGKARLIKFEDQFPDALDLIVRSLRIGHPLATSLQTIAREAPAPTNAEFAIASRQVTYGKTPAEAIDELAKRINSQDVRFFSVAVQIHHESGGNLGDILSGLSKIIRARFQLFRKVRALTAEGRFSAYFLSLFPVGMIFAMNALQPGYYEKVADFALFPHLVGITAFLLFVNVIAMRMITKLEV